MAAVHVRPPFLPACSVVGIIKDYFPFTSVQQDSIKELESYDDRNYYFRGDLPADMVPCYPSNQTVHITSNNEYVLKILNHRDSAERGTIEYLTEMKKYLYSNGYNVPFPIPSKVNSGSEIVTLMESDIQRCIQDGKPLLNESAYDTKQYHIRVLTFIPGVLLHDIPQSPQYPQLMFNVGEYMGNLHNKLKNFSHSAMKSRESFIWDLKHLHTLRYLIPKSIKDSTKLHFITKIVDDFEHNVVPHIPHLQHYMIHNDFNDLNIIVEKETLEINGVIDFSDCVYTPKVFDIGIAVAYSMVEKSDPVNSVIPLLAGYMSTSPVEDIELDLLYYIVLGRLAQSCIIGEYAYQMEPTNDYLLISVRPTWTLIEMLLTTGKEKCDSNWIKARHKTVNDFK